MVVMSLVLVFGFFVQQAVGEHVLRRERTFFGSYKVTEGSERRVLVHGTTSHGWEELSGPSVGEPTAYYTRSGPIGDVMTAYKDTPILDEVALVGMGVGTSRPTAHPASGWTSSRSTLWWWTSPGRHSVTSGAPRPTSG